MSTRAAVWIEATQDGQFRIYTEKCGADGERAQLVNAGVSKLAKHAHDELTAIAAKRKAEQEIASPTPAADTSSTPAPSKSDLLQRAQKALSQVGIWLTLLAEIHKIDGDTSLSVSGNYSDGRTKESVSTLNEALQTAIDVAEEMRAAVKAQGGAQ